MNRVNLILGLLWLLGAVALFAHEWLLGSMAIRIHVGNSSYTAAWVMLFFAVFNLMRWESDRWRGIGLLVGLVCLLCAIAILAYDGFMGGVRLPIRLGRLRISLGWLVLVMAVYNLLRWWGNRVSAAKQRALQMAWGSREWEKRRPPSEPLRPPDPNLNFSDEPAPPANRSVTDRPPSNN